MQVQIRRFLPDGETPKEVIDTARVRMADGVSSSSVLTFTVSVAVADGIRQWMDDNPGKPFVVGVERSNGDGWVEPRNGRFVAYKGSADDLDPTGSVQITCMDMVTWDLSGTYLHWSQYAKDGERLWTEGGFAASAGTIIGGMISESKARGWAPSLGRDFSSSTDSAGVAWTAAEKVLQGWKLRTPLSQVLDSLVSQGLCEWWAEGRTMRLFRPGTGVLRENVVLGGEGFTRAPGSWDYSNVFTDLVVVPEKASHWLYLPNPGADASTGRREATVTQSGVADHATATRLAQATLLEGRSAKREQSFEWPVVEGMPVPWDHFNVGDTLPIVTTTGQRLERVVELAVSVDEDGLVTAHAVTGDLMRSKASQRNQNTDNATLGGLVGGSGSPLPVTSPPALSDPLAPTSFRVASNVGSWRADGSAQSTVRLEWDAVSQTVDGSAVDIAGYEVAARTLTTDPVIFATVEALTVTASEWEPGKERLVKVRARDHRGQVSAWSGEISVIPEVPLSIVPKAPTGLVVVSNVGAFQADGSAVATVTVGWDQVTQSIDSILVDVVEYELQQGLATQRVSGLSGSVTLAATKTGTVRVRARTSLGVWGDPSAPLNITGASPSADLPAPSLTMVGGMGGVVLSWDGKLGGSTPPVGFARTVVELGASASGPWLVQGVPWVSAGSQSVQVPVGEKRWARARAFDTLGRAGSYSAVVDATAAGVPLGAIPGLDGELDAIRFTADGKNRVYVQETSPGVAVESRRNFVVNPDFGIDTLRWLGVTGGTISRDTSTKFSGSASLKVVAPGAAANEGAYYSPSTVPGLVSGDLVSGVARVKAPMGAQLIVMVTSLGAGASSPATSFAGTGDWQEVRVSGAIVGASLNPYILVRTATAQAVTFHIDAALLEKSPTAGSLFSGSTPPAPGKGYAWAGTPNASESIEYTSPFTPGDQWWVLAPDGQSLTGLKVWNGVTWVSHVLVAETIIATGSITGTLIKAGTIYVDNLHPSVGESLNLFANEAFNVLIGRTDAADAHLTTLDGKVSGAQTAADAAQTDANTAANLANTVGNRLDEHQTYYRFGAGGLEIGVPSGASALRLTPDPAVEMVVQGVTVSDWREGVFRAEEAQLQKVVVAGLRIEGDGDGGTLFMLL